MDKIKDQQSVAPAATDDKKTISLKKTGKNAKVIINPPEKVDPQRGFQERFNAALAKHTVILEKKTEIVLNAKASSAELPEQTIRQVYTRGYKSLPLNSNLTREQYAMNRVNSFIAGGAAMKEDYDLLPITERVGLKGSGGAMRPHIKREKNVYNGKTVFHVVNAKGQIKHSTGDEMQAKKHLATKYHSYLGEAKKMKGEDPCWTGYHMVGKKNKAGREVPNCVPEEVEQIDELSKSTLGSYVKNAARDVGASRKLSADFKNQADKAKKPSAKAASSRLSDKFLSTAQKRHAGISKAVERLTKEEVQPIVTEATSASVRMQRALERIRQSREASEKRAQELLKPKQPQEKK